uniref:Uncharacterized protein n=1 Tax=Cacopsylla melanoneura TaxID=428564 RepID=A0A8D8QR70_9HEMI
MSTREEHAKIYSKRITYYALYYIETATNIHAQHRNITNINITHNHNTIQQHNLKQIKTNTAYAQRYNNLPNKLRKLEPKIRKEKLIKCAPYKFEDLDIIWNT